MASARRAFDTWDVLKIVAMLLMFVDHAGNYVFNDDASQYYLRAVGRGAAPIFLFLAGYAKSYRFSWELLWLAVALTVFEWWFFWHIETLNILFSILASRAIFQWFEVRGRIIKRPVEWYVAGCALFVLAAVVDYGSLGFLIALAGYMRRHKEAYAPALRLGLSWLMLATFAAFQIKFFSMPIDPFISSGVMVFVFAWCMHFEVKEVAARLPGVLRHGLQLFSRYSGYIYVAHLVALMWITGVAPYSN